MHVAKYTRTAAAAMMHHYRRDRQATLNRDNIDRERTKDNYTVGFVADDPDRANIVTTEPVRMAEDGSRCIAGTKHVRSRGYDAIEDAIERIESQEGARRVRRDAIVMADLVVTLPDNVPDSDAGRFFDWVYIYMSNMLGPSNILGGYVHVDETTPHMHLAFMPVTKSAKGLDTFSFNKVFPRRAYRTLHKDMQAYLGEKMGYEPHLVLSDDERERRVYTERTEDIDRIRAATAALAATEQKKLDRATARVRDKEALSSALTDEIEQKEEESAAAKKEAEKAREDAQTAKEALAQAQSSVSAARAELESVNSDLNAKRRDLRKLEADTEEQRRKLAEEKGKVANTGAELIRAKRDVEAAHGWLSDLAEALEYADSATPDTYMKAVAQLNAVRHNPIVDEVASAPEVSERLDAGDRSVFDALKQAIMSAVRAAITAMRDVLAGAGYAGRTDEHRTERHAEHPQPVPGYQQSVIAGKLSHARASAGARRPGGAGHGGRGHGGR